MYASRCHILKHNTWTQWSSNIFWKGISTVIVLLQFHNFFFKKAFRFQSLCWVLKFTENGKHKKRLWWIYTCNLMGLMFSLITFESDKNLTFLRYYLTEDFLCACKNFCPKCTAKKSLWKQSPFIHFLWANWVLNCWTQGAIYSLVFSDSKYRQNIAGH